MKVLAFGAHPDDIEPQIGGTLAKLNSEGSDVTVITATATSTGAANASQRELEGRNAAKVIGSKYIGLGIDQKIFSFNRESISIFDELIKIESPDLVFTVSDKDSHHEHQFVYNCVKSASRKNTFSVITLSQAFPGGIGLHQYNYFTNISDFQKIKMKAIQEYESQISKYGNEWIEAIISRDKMWGFNINCSYAECGFVNKWVV